MQKSALSVFLLIATSSLFFSTAQANMKIVRKGNLLFYVTPYNEMIDAERREAVTQAVQLSMDTLENVIPHLSPSQKITMDIIDKMDGAAPQVDNIIGKIQTYVNNSQTLHSLHLYNLAPTGFIVFTGGKFSADFKVGGGFSAVVGIVILPFAVDRMNLVTKERKHYYYYDTALVAIPKLDLGGGLGGGPTWRVGAGLFWLPLEKASDFMGSTLAVSQSAVAGVGYNLKIGLLSQWNSMGLASGWNPYVMASWELGLDAEVTWHGNVGLVVPLTKFLSGQFKTLFSDYSNPFVDGNEKNAPTAESSMEAPVTAAPALEPAHENQPEQPKDKSK
jgi:hypothetical protein